MAKFKVTVEKMHRLNGVIEVEAKNGSAAKARVDAMMNAGLQTTDPRITWDEPEYVDFSFDTTGDVDKIE